MSSDRQSPKRNIVTRNLRLAYETVSVESVPERFQELSRRMDGDDELDLGGVSAEPPQRPKGGPKSSGAAAAIQRSE